MKRIQIAIAAILVGFCVTLFVLVVSKCECDKLLAVKKHTPAPGAFILEHIDEICISGHTYFYAVMANQAVLAPKFDSNGKPKTCNFREKVTK